MLIYIANYFRVALTESTNLTNMLINLGVIVLFCSSSYFLIISALLYISYEKLFKQYVDKIANKIGSEKEIYLISLLSIITFVGFYFIISWDFHRIFKILFRFGWLLIFSFMIFSQIAMPKLEFGVYITYSYYWWYLL